MSEPRTRPFHYIITRWLLVAFNIICLIFGLVFIGVGAWILVTDDAIYTVVSKGSPVGLSSLMIAAGCIIFVVSLAGCLGAFKESKRILLVFVCLLTLLFIIEIVLVSLAVVYQEEVEEYARDTVKKSVKEDYGESGENDLTKGVDKFQEKFECCGTDNYTDWDDSRWAKKNPTLKVPKSCCKTSNATCNARTAPISSIYTKTCLKELKEWVKDNLIIIGAVGGVVAFFELCGILMGLHMIKHINKHYFV